MSAQHCCKYRAIIVRRAGIICTLMTLTLSVCHTWGNPTLMLRSAGWMLALQLFQSCLSALAVSFLFRDRLRPSHPAVFFLPGICEKKKQWTEDLSGQWQASSRRLNARVPRRHRKGREHSPVLFTQHYQPPPLWATWSCLVRVMAK